MTLIFSIMFPVILYALFTLTSLDIFYRLVICFIFYVLEFTLWEIYDILHTIWRELQKGEK